MSHTHTHTHARAHIYTIYTYVDIVRSLQCVAPSRFSWPNFRYRVVNIVQCISSSELYGWCLRSANTQTGSYILTMKYRIHTWHSIELKFQQPLFRERKNARIRSIRFDRAICIKGKFYIIISIISIRIFIILIYL